jgi:hypothetical protein
VGMAAAARVGSQPRRWLAAVGQRLYWTWK